MWRSMTRSRFGRHVRGIVPMAFEPLLELVDVTPDVDVELDVRADTGEGEVGGTDQRPRADDGGAAVGDVGLGVELRLCVGAALDLTGLQRLDDRGDAFEEVVPTLLDFDGVIELASDAVDKDAPGAWGDLIAHENPDLVELLPLAIEREQRAHLEVSGGDVERVRNVAPLAQILPNLPFGIGVVDDEEIATLAARLGHGPLT